MLLFPIPSSKLSNSYRSSQLIRPWEGEKHTGNVWGGALRTYISGGRTGNRSEEREKLDCNAITTEVSAGSTGKSEAWRFFQNHPRQGGRAGLRASAKTSPWRHTACGKEDLYTEIPGKSWQRRLEPVGNKPSVLREESGWGMQSCVYYRFISYKFQDQLFQASWGPFFLK